MPRLNYKSIPSFCAGKEAICTFTNDREFAHRAAVMRIDQGNLPVNKKQAWVCSSLEEVWMVARSIKQSGIAWAPGFAYEEARPWLFIPNPAKLKLKTDRTFFTDPTRYSDGFKEELGKVLKTQDKYMFTPSINMLAGLYQLYGFIIRGPLPDGNMYTSMQKAQYENVLRTGRFWVLTRSSGFDYRTIQNHLRDGGDPGHPNYRLWSLSPKATVFLEWVNSVSSTDGATDNNFIVAQDLHDKLGLDTATRGQRYYWVETPLFDNTNYSSDRRVGGVVFCTSPMRPVTEEIRL